MTALTDARVTASLLDALVDVADAAAAPSGDSAATDALIDRLGARIAESLAEHADDAPTGRAALAARLGAVAAHLVPGGCVLPAAAFAADVPPATGIRGAGASAVPRPEASVPEVTGDVAVYLPHPDGHRLASGEPPTRIRVVASALGWLAARAAGQARSRLRHQLVDGATCWVQTISLDARTAAGQGETVYRRPAHNADGVLAHAAPSRPLAGPLAPPLAAAPVSAPSESASRASVPPADAGSGQSLDELAASVAHGLNNLLGAVAGQSSLLLDDANEDDAILVRASGLRMIHQAALDGASLARRLLQASRGARPTEPLTDAFELVDLGQVLVDALALTRLRWQDEAQRCGISIVPSIEVDQPLVIRGVAADLREIIVNLILNAVDAMPDGGHLRLRGDLRDDVVTVRCEDTGFGMSPEVLGRVFEPFFTTKGAAGTGMGMAILYGVVARHGGEVQVSSTPGVGTSVTLHLPAARLQRGVRGAGVRGTAAMLVDLGPDLRACDVLVVEDDPSFRTVFARRLALDARRVETVPDAESALLLLQARHWDLVCIDEGLPDASGRELAAEIHRRGLAGAVILVTGVAIGLDDPLLASAGVDAVLPKPCSDVELAVAVRAAGRRLAARLATSA